MTKQTEAERLADGLECDRWIAHGPQWCYDAAAELRRLVSFNQQLMDEVERLKKALAEREPVGKAFLCDRCLAPFDRSDECPKCKHGSATKRQVYTTPQAQPKETHDYTD